MIDVCYNYQKSALNKEFVTISILMCFFLLNYSSIIYEQANGHTSFNLDLWRTA